MSVTEIAEHYSYDIAYEQRFADLVARDNLAKVNRESAQILIPDSFYARYGKRILDIIISSLALIITAPINLILMVGTFFDVGRPLFFQQLRTGRGGTPFIFSKFRNMTNARNDKGELLPPDQRITKWGYFVRESSLDELLNFWYIFNGKMSVIGPRPLPVSYRNRFSNRHFARHLVRPGLECPLHDPDMGEMTWENRFENDIWYVQHVSLKTDLKLFFLLVRETLWGSRRSQRGGGKTSTFIGYFDDGHVMDSEHIPEKYYREVFDGTSS